jgi:hypothetical protein
MKAEPCSIVILYALRGISYYISSLKSLIVCLYYFIALSVLYVEDESD